jgi:replicative DNA helicase
VKSIYDQQARAEPYTEKSLLGSIMVKPDLLDEVRVVLRAGAEAFTSPARRTLYEVLCEAHEQQVEFDEHLLRDLAGPERWREIGGVEALAEAVGQVASGLRAPSYARIVQDAWADRRLYALAGEILDDQHRREGTVDERIGRIEDRLLAIRESRAQDEVDLIADLDALQAEIDAPEPIGLATGYRGFDIATGRLKPGNLYVIAARPSQGKTALLLSMVRNISGGNEAPCALYSLEMSGKSIAQRYIAMVSGVQIQRMHGNYLTDAERANILSAREEIERYDLHLFDRPGMYIEDIMASARTLVRTRNVQYVIIDYLQLARTRKKTPSREQEVAEVAVRAKEMSMSAGVPVLVAAQLNRGIEGRQDQRPRLSDLRESGVIEQAADVVGMIWHPDDDGLNETTISQLVIAKNRNGPTTSIDLQWTRHRMLWEDIIPQFTQPEPEDTGPKQQRLGNM